MFRFRSELFGSNGFRHRGAEDFQHNGHDDFQHHRHHHQEHGPAADPVVIGEARPIEGDGTNPDHPEWGAAGEELLRLADADFDDGIGALAEVFIRTGQRRAFSFLLKPLNDSLQRAFRED